MLKQRTSMERAKQSLLGLWVGDAFGSYFEMWRATINRRYISRRTMPQEVWKYTDDTEMALSIFVMLNDFGTINQAVLAKKFAERYDKSRGYGNGAMKLMKRIANGEDWRIASKDMFGGEGSFGNGGAMRVAPIGAYFADDLEALIENARLSAEVTHAHPEGIAVAVAVGVLTQSESLLSLTEFFERVLPHIPESEVRENCVKANTIPIHQSVDEGSKRLGNGRNVAAMDTVPIALWCAIKYLDNFEEAMWQLASIGGDVDTTCAITGSLIASYSSASIPSAWIDTCEPLPDWADVNI